MPHAVSPTFGTWIQPGKLLRWTSDVPWYAGGTEIPLCQPGWAEALAHLSELSCLPRKLLRYIKIHPGNPRGILRMENGL